MRQKQFVYTYRVSHAFQSHWHINGAIGCGETLRIADIVFIFNPSVLQILYIARCVETVQLILISAVTSIQCCTK